MNIVQEFTNKVELICNSPFVERVVDYMSDLKTKVLNSDSMNWFYENFKSTNSTDDFRTIAFYSAISLSILSVFIYVIYRKKKTRSIDYDKSRKNLIKLPYRPICKVASLNNLSNYSNDNKSIDVIDFNTKSTDKNNEDINDSDKDNLVNNDTIKKSNVFIKHDKGLNDLNSLESQQDQFIKYRKDRTALNSSIDQIKLNLINDHTRTDQTKNVIKHQSPIEQSKDIVECVKNDKLIKIDKEVSNNKFKEINTNSSNDAPKDTSKDTSKDNLLIIDVIGEDKKDLNQFLSNKKRKTNSIHDHNEISHKKPPEQTSLIDQKASVKDNQTCQQIKSKQKDQGKVIIETKLTKNSKERSEINLNNTNFNLEPTIQTTRIRLTEQNEDKTNSSSLKKLSHESTEQSLILGYNCLNSIDSNSSSNSSCCLNSSKCLKSSNRNISTTNRTNLMLINFNEPTNSKTNLRTDIKISPKINFKTDYQSDCKTIESIQTDCFKKLSKDHSNDEETNLNLLSTNNDDQLNDEIKKVILNPLFKNSSKDKQAITSKQPLINSDLETLILNNITCKSKLNTKFRQLNEQLNRSNQNASHQTKSINQQNDSNGHRGWNLIELPNKKMKLIYTAKTNYKPFPEELRKQFWENLNKSSKLLIRRKKMNIDLDDRLDLSENDLDEICNDTLPIINDKNNDDNFELNTEFNTKLNQDQLRIKLDEDQLDKDQFNKEQFNVLNDFEDLDQIKDNNNHSKLIMKKLSAKSNRCIDFSNRLEYEQDQTNDKETKIDFAIESNNSDEMKTSIDHIRTDFKSIDQIKDQEQNLFKNFSTNQKLLIHSNEPKINSIQNQEQSVSSHESSKSNLIDTFNKNIDTTNGDCIKSSEKTFDKTFDNLNKDVNFEKSNANDISNDNLNNTLKNTLNDTLNNTVNSDKITNFDTNKNQQVNNEISNRIIKKPVPKRRKRKSLPKDMKEEQETNEFCDSKSNRMVSIETKLNYATSVFEPINFDLCRNDDFYSKFGDNFRKFALNNQNITVMPMLNEKFLIKEPPIVKLDKKRTDFSNKQFNQKLNELFDEPESNQEQNESFDKLKSNQPDEEIKECDQINEKINNLSNLDQIQFVVNELTGDSELNNQLNTNPIDYQKSMNENSKSVKLTDDYKSIANDDHQSEESNHKSIESKELKVNFANLVNLNELFENELKYLDLNSNYETIKVELKTYENDLKSIKINESITCLVDDNKTKSVNDQNDLNFNLNDKIDNQLTDNRSNDQIKYEEQNELNDLNELNRECAADLNQFEPDSLEYETNLKFDSIKVDNNQTNNQVICQEQNCSSESSIQQKFDESQFASSLVNQDQLELNHIDKQSNSAIKLDPVNETNHYKQNLDKKDQFLSSSKEGLQIDENIDFIEHEDNSIKIVSDFSLVTQTTDNSLDKTESETNEDCCIKTELIEKSITPISEQNYESTAKQEQKSNKSNLNKESNELSSNKTELDLEESVIDSESKINYTSSIENQIVSNLNDIPKVDVFNKVNLPCNQIHTKDNVNSYSSNNSFPLNTCHFQQSTDAAIKDEKQSIKFSSQKLNDDVDKILNEIDKDKINENIDVNKIDNVKLVDNDEFVDNDKLVDSLVSDNLVKKGSINLSTNDKSCKSVDEVTLPTNHLINEELKRKEEDVLSSNISDFNVSNNFNETSPTIYSTFKFNQKDNESKITNELDDIIDELGQLKDSLDYEQSEDESIKETDLVKNNQLIDRIDLEDHFRKVENQIDEMNNQIDQVDKDLNRIENHIQINQINDQLELINTIETINQLEQELAKYDQVLAIESDRSSTTSTLEPFENESTVSTNVLDDAIEFTDFELDQDEFESFNEDVLNRTLGQSKDQTLDDDEFDDEITILADESNVLDSLKDKPNERSKDSSINISSEPKTKSKILTDPNSLPDDINLIDYEFEDSLEYSNEFEQNYFANRTTLLENIIEEEELEFEEMLPKDVDSNEESFADSLDQLTFPPIDCVLSSKERQFSSEKDELRDRLIQKNKNTNSDSETIDQLVLTFDEFDDSGI